MYLSIGNDMAVRHSTIIGIFDLDNTTINARGREFLERAEKEGQIVPWDDLPKSYILTSEYGMTKIYQTSLSTQTLEKRLKWRPFGRHFFKSMISNLENTPDRNRIHRSNIHILNNLRYQDSFLHGNWASAESR